MFKLAYANGVALLTDEFGLRERRPHRIEWKGPHRTPGYELMPIDLRIDHVFLVSCKYESHLLFNSSPWHLFDRLLAIRHGSESGDWFLHIAGDAYERLYRQTVDALGVPGLPDEVSRLDRSSRDRMRSGLVGRWPDGVVAMYREFAEEVSRSSARWWGDRLPTLGAREEMLWRMLRISSAPYFVLGQSGDLPMRFRIYTPWDWRREFTLKELQIASETGRGQPVVSWTAHVLEQSSRQIREVKGHVEIRWSHGRFQGNPEAKVYLDTRHDEVPGYAPLST